MLHAKLGEISGQNCVHGQTDGRGGGGVLKDFENNVGKGESAL